MLAAGQDHRQSAVIRNRSEATARKREVSNAYKQFAVAALLFRITVAALLFCIAVAALLFRIAVAALLLPYCSAMLLFSDKQYFQLRYYPALAKVLLHQES